MCTEIHSRMLKFEKNEAKNWASSDCKASSDVQRRYAGWLAYRFICTCIWRWLARDYVIFVVADKDDRQMQTAFSSAVHVQQETISSLRKFQAYSSKDQFIYDLARLYQIKASGRLCDILISQWYWLYIFHNSKVVNVLNLRIQPKFKY